MMLVAFDCGFGNEGAERTFRRLRTGLHFPIEAVLGTGRAAKSLRVLMNRRAIVKRIVVVALGLYDCGANFDYVQFVRPDPPI